MTGRRRYPRYVLAEPVDGHLRIRNEVVIDRRDDHEIEARATQPCRPDERLLLEVPGDGSGRIVVRVLESRPVLLENGGVQHQLRLLVEP